MILKKSELKKTLVTVIVSILVLIVSTYIFKLYHDSSYVKSEYARICPQNYGDPVSLDRCYWPYKFEGKTFDNALKAEVITLFVGPILIFIATLF